MKKIAILGCENSHANGFLRYINANPKLDVEVVGVYSDETEPCEELSKTYNVYVAKSYDEFVGKVDGIVITARHGDNHYKYAKPYINSGIPMFIDKPSTISEKDAVEFAKELKANNVRITGGSCCKYFDNVIKYKEMVQSQEYGEVRGGYFIAPMQYDSEYGGFYFYTQHMVQMICEIYGCYPQSVMATRNSNTVSIVIDYDGYSVCGTYVEHVNQYYALVNFEKKMEVGHCTFEGVFDKEFEEYFSVLFGAEQRCSYKDFFAPVYILNAIVRSIESGKREYINTMEEI